MPILLARVDDRLIHGQVVHGWGRPLNADFFAIVSDELSADPERAELYLFAVPEGAAGRAVSVADALGAEFRSAAAASRTILLFADLATPRRLAEGGFPLEALNVGGLHHAPGKHEVLPYVFLDAGDRDELRRLATLGVPVTAQDLPGNEAHDLSALVGTE
ncbi:MAG TPA: PTS sugar transporter subunit IIB [Candidatus Eisenbacteria bacterium]|nr:PTS sugar transporter subunit IIB [Candidatus Eisenbacteria bacterium]